MSAGGITQLVDSIHNGIGSRIGTNGIVSTPHIVFDGTRDAYHVHAQLGQLPGTCQGTCTADDNQPLNAPLLEIFQGKLALLRLHELRAAGSTQKSTAPLNHITHAAGAQLLDLVANQALVAVAHTPNLDAIMTCRANYGTNSGIHARTVISTSKNSNIFQHIYNLHIFVLS